MKRFALLVILLVLSAAPMVKAEDKTIELKVGEHIALADLVVPDDANLKDGVVLITHGTMAHKDMELIGALQSALAENGIPSLAHTLTLGQDRREGMFPCTAIHSHLNENALKEIDAWVDWLGKQGAGPITLVGHSRGGEQVASYAKENENKVAKVVLVAATSSGAKERQKKSYQEKYGVDLDKFAEKAAELTKEGKFSEVIDLPGFLSCPASKVQAQTITSYYGPDAGKGAVRLIDQLKQPVLVIAGSKDQIVPDLADEVRPKADGKKVILDVIEDADHFFLDFYADDAGEKIASFVRGETE